MNLCTIKPIPPSQTVQVIENIEDFCSSLEGKIEDSQELFRKLHPNVQCLFLKFSWKILLTKETRDVLPLSYFNAYRIFRLFRTESMKSLPSFSKIYPQFHSLESTYKSAKEWCQENKEKLKKLERQQKASEKSKKKEKKKEQEEPEPEEQEESEPEPEEQEEQEPTEITVEDYSDRAIVVRGDTKDFSEAFKKLNGRWNRLLTGGPGWIFSKTKKDVVRKIIDEGKSVSVKKSTSKSPSKSTSKSPSSSKKTTSSTSSRSKKYDKEFQKFPEITDEMDSLYLFYTSLYKSNPKSPLAITWLTEHGFFDGKERANLIVKYKKLSTDGKLIK